MNDPAPKHFFDLTPDTLREWCVDRGMKPFRSQQMLDWVYRKGVIDPNAMTNLAPPEREQIKQELVFLSGPTVAHQVASDGTQKLLIEWPRDLAGARVSEDEAAVDHSLRLPLLDPDSAYGERRTECVMIPAGEPRDGQRGAGQAAAARRTACVSSQIGCAVGCRFCATGLGGLEGNLSAGRIVEQVWRLAQLPGVGRISHVVFMGMGEPLNNLKQVVRAVRTLAAPWGLGIGARRITISTVGMHRAIERLADELDLPVTLALSLHAPNDELRRDLIPYAEFTTIDELFIACRRWFEKTGREITLEYTLLRDVNDRPEHAAELAAVAKRLRANINLIRFNEVAGVPFARPLDDEVHRFQHILRERGVNTHIRASRGRDIAAACGQLRRLAEPRA